jgi:hypothetical protein
MRGVKEDSAAPGEEGLGPGLVIDRMTGGDETRPTNADLAFAWASDCEEGLVHSADGPPAVRGDRRIAHMSFSSVIREEVVPEIDRFVSSTNTTP